MNSNFLLKISGGIALVKGERNLKLFSLVKEKGLIRVTVGELASCEAKCNNC